MGLNSEQQTVSAAAESQENIHPEGNFEPSGRGGERLRPCKDVQENESDADAYPHLERFTSKGGKKPLGRKNLDMQ